MEEIKKDVQEIKEEVIDDEKFAEIMDTIKGSNASINVNSLMSILGSLISNTQPDSKSAKEFAKILDGKTPEELISSSILYACNSIVINMWTLFGPRFKQLYDLEQSKLEESKANAN